MTVADPLAWLDAERAAYAARGLSRTRRVRAGGSPLRGTIDGRPVVNFGSNDYLGLAGDPRLREAAASALAEAGFGAGASSLVTGRTDEHAALEADLAAFEGTESALLLPTGYAANLGVIPALVGRGDVIVSDAKNHASLIDGCRLSGATVTVVPHGDVAAFEAALVRAKSARRRLVVTDGLFSMDGDLAPLADLVPLARRHGAMLLIDEAHATGVFGSTGRGSFQALIEDRRAAGDGATSAEGQHAGVVRVGTLSKALGGLGGFVVGTATLIGHLAERVRPYVFSTAAPAALAAAGRAALAIVRDEPHRRRELLARAEAFRRRLLEAGLTVGPSVSPIVPIVLGDPDRATAASARLAELGFWVPGIRPPTVPEGESLLRVSLSWGHTDDEVARLADVLASLSVGR